MQEIYRDKARYCVVIVSEPYAEKLWTTHEPKQAQARAFKQDEEYILPLLRDDTDLPGLNETTEPIDLRNKTVEQAVDLLLEKLGW